MPTDCNRQICFLHKALDGGGKVGPSLPHSIKCNARTGFIIGGI